MGGAGQKDRTAFIIFLDLRVRGRAAKGVALLTNAGARALGLFPPLMRL